MMSGGEISSIAMNHNHTKPFFRGVYASDMLPKFTDLKPKFIIVNTDTSLGKGEHWILVIISGCYSKIEFFDPLGYRVDQYSPELIGFLTRDGKQSFLINTDRVQSLTSEACGYFCLYVADKRCKGETYSQCLKPLLKDLDKLQYNDFIVKSYVNIHMRRK